MLCVRLIVKSHQEVVEEEYQELIEKDVGEGNIDEGDEVVLDNT